MAIRPLKSEGTHAWYCYHDPQRLETELPAALKYSASADLRELNGA